MKEMGSLATGESNSLRDNVNIVKQKKGKGTKDLLKPPRPQRPEGCDWPPQLWLKNVSFVVNNMRIVPYL